MKEIEQILTSMKAKFIRKQVTKVTSNLAMILESKNIGKQKATSKNKCFNCLKFDYFRKDYRNLD